MECAIEKMEMEKHHKCGIGQDPSSISAIFDMEITLGTLARAKSMSMGRGTDIALGRRKELLELETTERNAA